MSFNVIDNRIATTALAGKITLATAALVKGATNNNSAVVPAFLGSHPSVNKAWVNFNGTGTVAINASYNVSSITDNGVGDYTINFTTAMGDAFYAVSGSAQNTGGNGAAVCIKDATSPTTTAVNILVFSNTAFTVDSGIVGVQIAGNAV